MKKTQIKTDETPRPPIVTIMGHIDHGKSTLLDYIRKTNITEKETGGITQYLSAYEAVHTSAEGEEKNITFLDTPGHMAFADMRSRGAKAADIAILVVSAEDGVKEQTLEAHKCIMDAKIPFVVAITKIDKPGANVEKTKTSLSENKIYLEGLGGDISFVPISSKTGEGISEMLDIILLLAEMENLHGNRAEEASGYVIESHIDIKRGTSATLIITNGTLKKGMYVVAGQAIAPLRLMENFIGAPVNEISFSSPVRITGFSELPKVGSLFEAYKHRETAKKAVMKNKELSKTQDNKKWEIKDEKNEEKLIIPIVIKTDVLGVAQAIATQIEKISKSNDTVLLKVIYMGVGPINENDLLLLGKVQKALILGFNVKADALTQIKADRAGVSIALFNIIYDLTDFVLKYVKDNTPKKNYDKIIGIAKILRSFSRAKDKQVIGGDVTEGALTKNANFKIMRRDIEIGRGKILGLQQQKVSVAKVEQGNKFGMQTESKVEISQGDKIEAFEVTTT